MLNRNIPRIQTTGGRQGVRGSRNDVVDQAAKQGTLPSLHRAVIMDVIVKPDELSADYKQQLTSIVNNPELIEVMPVNAVIARLVSTGQGLINVRDTILFPFFSSHIMLPVQPGELVYVIYEDLANFGDKIGYWITRPHGQGTIEDVNFTHNDRQFDAKNNLGFWNTDQKLKIEHCPPPNFQNGGGTTTTETIASTQDNVNPYDVFAQQSPASKLTTPEPVPRWHKRPQELVLQGANNTLIMMGEDRSGHVSGAISPTVNQNNRLDQKGFSGTIDMVVGRGRMMPLADNNHNSDPANSTVAPSIAPPLDQTPEGTAPRVIQNARGTFETDKAPFRQKRSDGGRGTDSAREGDPDFDKDAARILISMQTEADVNFGLADIQYPDKTLAVQQPQASAAKNQSNVSGSFNRSYVIQKGDHIRVVARKDTDLNVNGTILLIKEGDPNAQDTLTYGFDKQSVTQDKDLAYIYFTDDGIQISAKNIYVGPSTDKQEPYVLWSNFAHAIDNLQQQIRELANNSGGASNGIVTALTTIFAQMMAVGASPANICIPMTPNPAVAAIGVVANTIWTQTMNIPGADLSNHTTQGTDAIQQLQEDNMKNYVSKDKQSTIIFGV